MTKTIVVPLDGSELAERSIGTASWLARDLDCEIRLVTTTIGAESDADADYLQEQADTTGVSYIRTEVIEHRFPAAGIKETVETMPDPVVCMSTRGRGGLAETILGGVSDEIVKGVQVPLVLLGPYAAAGDPPSRSLVIAIDRSDASLAVLPTVVDWAPRLGLDVHVVTVAQCGTTGGPDPRAAAANELVDEAASKLEALGVTSRTHVLNSAHSADVVVAFARGLPAALIAIGTHGRGGISARALGTVAGEIVRHSPCPVLVRRIPD